MVSRVAKNPIEVPAGVDVKLEGQRITIKGKNGEMQQMIDRDVRVTYQDHVIRVMPVDHKIAANAAAGTMQILISNMIQGITQGFVMKLQLVGVGYRAKAQSNILNLTLGFSHPVNFPLPAGITAETPSQTEIIIKGVDKQKVCQVAANIRALRPPEPYKGKGVRYDGEVISLKEGKKK